MLNISTGEADKNADDAVLHLKVLENHATLANETDNFGSWFNNCLW